MKAVAKLRPENGAMALIDMEQPVAGPGEALVKITAGGICGTDVAIWKWHEAVVGQYAPNFPLVVGHEFAGTVISAGPQCRAVEGDTVAINPQIACGRCEYCGLGRPTLCVDRRLMGGRINGGWTEYVTVPEQNLHPLPKGLDSAVAPLLEPLSVATHAVSERVPVRPGDVVAVIGAGPIGLLVAILAKAAGASAVVLTGIGADKGRLELAASLGFIPVNVEEADAARVVKAIQWDGADVVYETSGNASVFDQAVGLSRRTGRIGLIGLCHGATTFKSTPIVLRELEVIGSRGYNETTWSLMMRQLPAVAGDVLKLVTHEVELKDFEQALGLVERREGMKIILRP
ncbi:L-iditol 2-dehydrogenase [Rhizobium sp. NFR07]|uniref:zinc-dependent alcohol dehydrogenase n=1 Tax=Rhizobium sp. NFR07 TaxID=1566262 RepID=UPI0008EC6EC2|nr:alcohol dehydrogenase catalytic domain-containing protein [Rhizobium sp. NFR07]SFB30380.1 L-iditol 2-dehydrogenase [Rhizobium sp. NFR07]